LWLIFAVSAHAQNSWASDITEGSVGESQDLDVSLGQYADDRNPSNLIWIEFAFNRDHSPSHSKYRLEGWWGIGQDGFGGTNRNRLEFGQSPTLRRIGVSESHSSILTECSIQGQETERIWSNSAVGIRIDHPSFFPVYLQSNIADSSGFPVKPSDTENK